MSHSCSSYHLGIKRNNQLQISMLPTSSSETEIALFHHQKEQSMKTMNELVLWAVRNYHTTLRNQAISCCGVKIKSVSSIFALKCNLTWKNGLSTRYSRGIGIYTSNLVIDLTCGTQGNYQHQLPCLAEEDTQSLPIFVRYFNISCLNQSDIIMHLHTNKSYFCLLF